MVVTMERKAVELRLKLVTASSAMQTVMALEAIPYTSDLSLGIW